MEIVEGLTFDDVLLVPAESDVMPGEVSTPTEVVEGITLNTPIMSSAMDTVTEADGHCYGSIRWVRCDTSQHGY